LLDREGEFGAAAAFYNRARDLDELRFRAPGEFNGLVRAAAEATGSRLVDVEEHLRRVSRGGIVGANVMTEHLHPNIEGYFLIADAFYEALVRDSVLGTPARIVSDEGARREILITAVDSLVGLYRIANLTSGWPFKPVSVPRVPIDTLSPGTFVGALALDLYERKISRLQALEMLHEHYLSEQEWKLALQSVLAVIQRYPFLPRPYLMAAGVLATQERFDEALEYAYASLEREESALALRLAGSILLTRQRRVEAISRLERSLELEPNDATTLYNLAGAWALEGNRAKAVQLVDRALEIQPSFDNARRLRESLGD
jgi:tetratricopeptide (TPR) repeat protein